MTQTIALPLATDADPFTEQLIADGQKLRRAALTTLQLNLGKMCNLACNHCHVEAGPGRTEIMAWSTAQRILDWVDRYRDQAAIETVDLTGGAPEMNPHFRRIVTACKERSLHILDRCNLTILLEPGYEDMIAFLAQHQVEIVASLPCYIEENVDKQRGSGVFGQSIEALVKLNQAGYAAADSPLHLDLVYNPVGYTLPPPQKTLEAEYKEQLKKCFGIVFNRLWTITNMPIKRFAHALHRDGQYASYMTSLIGAHHSENVDAVMCRSLVSVGWQGSVYDCDFNQMLAMPIDGPVGDEHGVEADSRKLWEFTPQQLLGRPVRTGAHCFGCTAGAGSSCTGTLV